jgi:hypothetical protein
MRFLGNDVVWDAANNRVLCRMNGVYETKDPREIEILSKSYEVDPTSLTKKELLDKYGGDPKMTKKELLEQL